LGELGSIFRAVWEPAKRAVRGPADGNNREAYTSFEWTAHASAQRIMMIYTRDLSAGYTVEQLYAVDQHVRDHLAGAADPDDSPDALAGDVVVRHEELPYGGMRVIGTLDAEPDAPYLKADYDPDEAERNGL